MCACGVWGEKEGLPTTISLAGENMQRLFVTAGQTASDKYREIGHAIRYGISVAVAMSSRQINSII